MSGIAGIYFLDGRPVERTDVQRMMDGMAHRGPDGSGVWCDGSVGLGHQMLWTTPESLHEKLPNTNETGDLAITADARIDNRDELIPLLNFNGRPRERIPDSEVILAAYEKWGEQCPAKLLGDFSFVIWDNRKRKLFCARDPIGIKPFYYHFDGKTFRWASEPRAIFEGSTIAKEPNLTLMCLYLLNRFDEREETLYKNIYRLPGSQFMVIEDGKLRRGEYWDIDPNYSIRYKTDEEYAEHFLHIFQEAVKARLRSHGPVGASLSGGLDSSSIVCTAMKLYEENAVPNRGFETFSIVFDTFPCDEREYIKELVNKWNVKANYFTYEDNLSWGDFEQVQQYADVAYFPTLLFLGSALKDAEQKGIRIILDGIGGDDLLALDVSHLTDLMLQGRLREMIVQIRYDSSVYSCSPSRLFFDHCLKPLIPQHLKTSLKELLKPFLNNGIPRWIGGAYVRKQGSIKRMMLMPSNSRFPTHAQKQIYQMLRHGWNANIVLDMAERYKAHFGIETRYPFFDRKVVEFSLALPEKQRWWGEWSKVVLRQAMSEILPDQIKVRRDKGEFSSIIVHEFGNRQYQKVKNLLETSEIAALGAIQIDWFLRFLESSSLESGPEKVIDFINALERVVWLELWYRSAMIKN